MQARSRKRHLVLAAIAVVASSVAASAAVRSGAASLLEARPPRSMPVSFVMPAIRIAAPDTVPAAASPRLDGPGGVPLDIPPEITGPRY